MPADPIITRLKNLALSMCGLEDITHAPNDFTQTVLDAANRAVQECSVLVDDRFHYEERRGVFVQPKVVATADVTNGAMTLAGITPAAWMAGCTIQIEGSPVFNSIRKVDSSYVLARPYLGPTGTHAATIWHDTVQLPSDVVSIKEPLFYGDLPLDLVEADALRKFIGETTNRTGSPSCLATISSKLGDSPMLLACLMDALPEGNSEIVYSAAGRIANFADLNDTRTAVMPMNMEVSTLLPIFQFHFSTYQLSNVSKQDLGVSYQLANIALERTPQRSGASSLKRPKRT